MKSKIIIGILIVAVIGGTAIAATKFYKSKPINKVLYSENTTASKTVEDENITLFIPNVTGANKPDVTNNGKEYISETYSPQTGKLISTHQAIDRMATTSEKNPTFLGQATIKKANTNGNIIDSRGLIFYIPCKKIEVKLPIGTKLNVLWTAKAPISYNKTTHKFLIKEVVAVEYNGKVAFMSSDYLNLDNVAIGEAAMKLVSKNQLKNVHYIGQSKIEPSLWAQSVDKKRGKPFPIMMSVDVNGHEYNYNIYEKTVNVISYGKRNEYHLTSNEMMGETFGPAIVYGQTSAKIEYDGMIGYTNNMNLSNSPINKQINK